MPDINNNRKVVYDALVSSGYSGLGKDFDEFSSYMDKDENRRVVYNALRNEGYTGVGKDYDEFSSFIFATPEDERPQSGGGESIREVGYMKPETTQEALPQGHTFTAEELGTEPAAEKKEEVFLYPLTKKPGVLSMSPQEHSRGLMEQAEARRKYEELSKMQGMTTGRKNVIESGGKFYTPMGVYDDYLEAVHYLDESGMTDRLTKASQKKMPLEEERKRLIAMRDEVQAKANEREKELRNSVGNYQFGMAPITGNQASAIADEQLAKYNATYNNLTEAIRELDDRIKEENPGFWRGVADATIKNPSFYTMGLSDASDARAVLDVSEKGVLSDDDENLLDALYTNKNLQETSKKGFRYRAGNMFGHSIPFMVQMAATGGFQGVSSIGTKVAGEVAKKTLKKRVLSALGTMADDLIEASLIANTAGGGSTLANVAERRAGKIAKDENGNYEFKDKDGWLEAAYKGEMSSILEMYSEKFGNHLDGKLSLVKGLDKLGASKLSKALLAVKSSDLYNGANTVLKSFGVNGILPEVLEEELNLVANALTVGDNKFSDLYNPQIQADIIGGLALTVGGMRVIPGTIASIGFAENMRRVNSADKKAQRVFGDMWEEMRTALNETPNEAIAKKVAEYLENTNKPSERETLLNYYKQMMVMRGYNIGTTKIKEVAPGAEAAYQEAYDSTPTGSEVVARTEALKEAEQSVRIALGLADDADLDFALGDTDAMVLANNDKETAEMIDRYRLLNAQYKGMQDAVKREVEERSEEYDASIDARANNGVVYSTKLRDGTEVFITAGKVVLNNEGFVDSQNSEGLIVQLPDGTKKPVKSIELVDEVRTEQAEELKAAERARITAEVEQRLRGEIVESAPDQSGENTEMVEPIQQTETTQVLPKEKQEVQSIPMEKRGKVERAAYHLVPIERTMEDLHDGTLEPEEIEGLIDARVKEAESDVKAVENKKPVIGADKNAYLTAKEQWKADMEAAQAKLDYYNRLKKVNAEATRSEMRDVVEGVQPQVLIEQTADEFVANLLGGIKITPESFQRETGLKSEQKQLVGVIAGADKGGITVEQAAEQIVENYGDELAGLGFNGDVQDMRDMIINILSNGNPRSYAKKGAEMRAAQSVDEQMSQWESLAIGMGFKDTQEMIEYEEAVVPRIIQDYTGFDEIEYFNNLAENYKYDTTRESESAGRGGELLQGKQSADNAGDTNIAEPGQGGNVQGDVYSGGENATPQGNQQQIGSSEIPNNQIPGLKGYTTDEVLNLTKGHITDILGGDISIVDMRVIGSRSNGTNSENSDLDVLVEFDGDISEDAFFNAVNGEDALYIDGVRVDINPITKDKSGTIEQWMNRNAGYSKTEGGNAPGQGGVSVADDAPAGKRVPNTLEELAQTVLDKAEDNRRKPLRKRAEKWAKKLGVKVHILESYDEVTNEQAKAAILEMRTPGWFSNGEVYIYMPHIIDEVDLDKTIVHESVAHKGIKQMLGEEFNKFLENVWNAMSDRNQMKYLGYIGAIDENGNLIDNPTQGQMRAAADEYVAALAEKVYKKQGMTAEEKNIWQKVADWVRSLFSEKFNADEAKAEVLAKEVLTDEDIAKMIRASYETLQSNKADNEVASVDGDKAMFRLIGEKRAAELDATEGVTTRMDALKIAKVLEDIGEEDWVIEKATKWRRIKDGQWRYDLGKKKRVYNGRELYNPDLTDEEKRAIQKYIEFLPEETIFDYPLSFENNGYLYIFNTAPKYYWENRREEGTDGFHILRKIDLNNISNGEQRNIENLTDEDIQSPNKVIVEFESEQNNNQSGGSSSAETTTKMGIDGVDIQDNGGPQSRRGRDIAESVEDERGEVTPQDSESGIRFRKVTDPFKVAELEASPKRKGYRNVVLNADGSFGSPMANNLKGTSKGADKVKTETFRMNEWEEAEENPSLADENGKITLVKPSGKSVDKVDYNPYIHNRLDPVNLQFKDAWQRDDLVYVETEVPEVDLNSGYHADKAAKPVGVHSWSNGALMLSRYDKPVRILPWEEVADAWAEKLNGKGVNFDRVPAAMRELLVERGVEILPPTKGMGKDANKAYEAWKSAKNAKQHTMFRKVTPEMDAEYMTAVENGDMEAAERLVKEAAKLAMPDTKVVDEDGYPMVVYHRTPNEFTIFDQEMIGASTDAGAFGSGFYLSPADFGSLYGKNLMPLFVNLKNPLILNYANAFDTKEPFFGEDYSWGKEQAENFSTWVKNNGYDGVWYENNGRDEIVATEPNQMKSADAVTYDDNGNVVPLSERFNEEKEDIRFRKVFHGSGAKFDKFDHSFMGTGEGAQAFGWGTYVTEVESIGRTYASTMRDKNISEKHKENAIINNLARQTLASNNGDKNATLEELRNLLNESWSDKKRVKAEIKIIETGKFLPETKVKANLYSVEIPDDNGSNYLYWKADNNQETIGKLNEAYRNMLLERGVPAEDISPYFEPFNKGLSGESIYKIFARELGSDKAASQFLNRQGFVGISYPANATTGGRADGARNYVIFNEDDAQIEDRTMFRRANKNQEVFVSNAQRAVEGIKQEKATPEQWIAMIKKNGGLKAGEDKWMGLEEWLNEKQGAVTKQEILDYIGENKIQIEEVEYEDLGKSIDYELAAVEGNLERARRDLAYEEAQVPIAEKWLQDSQEEYDNFLSTANRLKTEYGENSPEYRNYIFYDSYTDVLAKAKRVLENAKSDVEYRRQQIAELEKAVKEKQNQKTRGINRTRLDYTTVGLERKREIALTVPTIEPYNESDEVHFGDAGNGRAVAWVRFGETTDSEGNRVLVIDEIQSKRHQEGREKGYRSNADKFLKDNGIEVVETDTHIEFYKNGEIDKSFAKALFNTDIEKAKNLYVAGYEKTAVPAAPFEKNWHELAMKRMLRLAAEEGFDKVAWTTGEQQAERYALSRSVADVVSEDNNIEVFENGVAVAKDIRITTNTGSAIDIKTEEDGTIHGGEYDGKNIGDVVGKELAAKLMNPGYVFLSGDGLRIGGEGMKGFYDKMLPSFVSKYAKKWGAKVGTVEMPSLEQNNVMHSVDVTPEMQESVMEGQTMFRFIGKKGAANLDKAEEAATRLDNLNVAREMESAGKDAKTIKLATGWERGADGKWRYETEDAKVNREAQLFGLNDNKRYPVAGFIEKGRVDIDATVRLDKLIDDEALFDAYPGLREYYVTFEEMEPGTVGSHNYDDKVIRFNRRESIDKLTSTLNHEIQHAIQHIEGFALGSNVERFADVRGAVLDSLNFMTNGDLLNGSAISDVQSLRDALNKKIPYTEMSVKEGYADNLQKVARKYGYENIDALVDDFTNMPSAFEQYRRTAGEVESRNVQERMGMTPEERRNSLAEETADVAKEDQIFLFENQGISAMGTHVDNRMNEQEESTLFRKMAEKQSEDELALTADAVAALGEKIGVPVRVVTDAPEKRKKLKGWFENGEVVVALPNHVSMEDAVTTVLHEVVGRRGLRSLMGDKMDELLDVAYNGLSTNAKSVINNRVMRSLLDGKPMDKRVAMEEYLSNLAKNGFEGNEKLWGDVKQLLGGFLNEYAGVEIPDGEMRYLLWKNYQRLQMPSVMTAAEDLAMEVKTQTGEFTTLFRVTDDYERGVRGFRNKFKEGWYDEMRSLKVAQDAIEKELGREIADSENVYLKMNHLPSVNKIMKESFDNKFLRPFTKLLSSLSKFGLDGKAIDNKTVERYSNAKHGLERNREMAVKEALTRIEKNDGKRTVIFNNEGYDVWRKGKEAIVKDKSLTWREKQDKLDKLANTFGAKIDDFSGFTALFAGEKKMSYDEMRNKAMDFVERFEGAIGEDNVKEFWDLVKGMTGFALKQSYTSGLLGKGVYDSISSMYEWYVPLRGFNEKTAEDYFDYVVEDNMPLNATLVRARGRKSEAGNIFATILNMANSAIVQGNKNKAKQALMNLANSGTGLLSVDNAWYWKNGDEYVPASPNIVEGMTPEEMAEVFAAFDEKMKMAEREGLATRYKPGLAIDANFDKRAHKNQHAVIVKRNGVEYVVWVNASPTLANAVNGLLRVEYDAGWIDSINRFRASAVTQYSPQFVLTNAARDAQSSSIVYASRRGKAMLGKYIRNVGDNVLEMPELYMKYKKGTLDMNVAKERLFKEFLENGGETGYSEMLSIEEYEKILNKLTEGLNIKNATVRAFEAAGGLVEFANRSVENLYRFSAYQTSREAGISVLKSIEDAKEVSVNFNRKGSGAYGNAFFKKTTMFLNPAIQSAAQRIVLASKAPKEMAGLLAAEFALGALQSVLFGLLSSLWGDDDEDKMGNYYNLTDYRRRSSLCLPLPNGVINIPLSHEERVFFGLGELFASMLTGHEDYDNVPMQAFNVIAQALPINPVDGWAWDDNLGETLIANLSPDFVKPIVEVAMNRDFAGNKVHNRTDFNTHLPEYLRGKGGTARPFMWLSELMSGAEQGTAKTWADKNLGAAVNPSAMEHIVKGYLGGAYTFADKFAKSALALLGDEEFAEVKNIPLLSSFYTDMENYEASPQERTRRDWERAYNYYKDEVKLLDDQEKTAKVLVRSEDKGGADVLEAMKSDGRTLIVDVFGDGEKLLKELYGEVDAAKKAKDFDRVKELDDEIYGQKRIIVERMEKMAENPMIGYTFRVMKDEDAYGLRETYGDVRDAQMITDFKRLLKPVIEEEKRLSTGAKEKENEAWKKIKDLSERISKAKGLMDVKPQEADELMTQIRNWRSEAVELINKYNE